MNKEVTLCYYHRKYDEYQDYYEKYYNDEEEEEGSLKPTDDGNNAINGGTSDVTEEQIKKYRFMTGDYTSSNEQIMKRIQNGR